MRSDEDKQLDDFLRQSLGKYEPPPPPGIWKAIVQNIPYKPFGKYFPTSPGGLIATIGGFVVTTATVVYLATGTGGSSEIGNDTMAQEVVPHSGQVVIPQDNQSSPQSQTGDATLLPGNIQEQQAVNPGKSSPSTLNPSRPSGNYGRRNYNNGSSPLASAGSMAIGNNATLKTPASQGLNAKVIEEALVDGTSTNQSNTSVSGGVNNDVQQESSLNTGMAESPAMEAVSPGYTLTTLEPIYHFVLEPKALASMPEVQPFSEAADDFRLSTRRKNNYALMNGEIIAGLYYRPEWQALSDVQQMPGNRMTAGMNIALQKNSWLFETGLELGKESRDRPRQVDFYDYLGTYNNLDSITFTLSPAGPVPHYHYSLDTVYDTDLSTEIQLSRGDYYFLRMPFLFGYSKQFSRLSLGLKAGPVLSLMLFKDEHDFSSLNPEDKIDEIYAAEPVYLNLSMQWAARIALRYYFNDRFGLSLEPGLQGYLSGPFGRKSTQNDKPCYFGLQSGIFYQW